MEELCFEKESEMENYLWYYGICLDSGMVLLPVKNKPQQ